MSYCILGLGNIGKTYEGTRHNIGFMVLDRLCEHLQVLGWQQDTHAFFASAVYEGKKLYLVKPTTYMNLSGRAVQHYVHYYKVPLSQLIVITDDIALDYGVLRFRAKGSDGGHNGLKHIQQMLGTNEYPRLRIGVGNHFSQGKQADYVLSKFSPEEMKTLPLVIEEAAKGILCFVKSGLQTAMNQFNKQVM